MESIEIQATGKEVHGEYVTNENASWHERECVIARMRACQGTRI